MDATFRTFQGSFRHLKDRARGAPDTGSSSGENKAVDISSQLPLAALVAVLAYGAGCLWLAHRLTRAQTKPPMRGDAARDAVGFPARDGRSRVQGWYLPAAAGQAAVVLVNRHAPRHCGELAPPARELAQALHAKGLTVLVIDLRGEGGSSAHRGSFGRAERHDVLGAVDYLLERGYRPGHIGVLGSGVGANAVLAAAAEEPAIGAVLADGAGLTPARLLQHRWRRLPPLAALLAPGVRGAAWLLGASLFDEARLQDRLAALQGRPLLLVHGRADRRVPAEAAHALALSAFAQWWLVDNRLPGASRESWGPYAARATGFFCQHLLHPRTVCVIWPQAQRPAPAPAWERLAA